MKPQPAIGGKKRTLSVSKSAESSPKKHRHVPSLNSKSSIANWESLSPSTGDAIDMVEAFLRQDEQDGPYTDVLPPEAIDAAAVQTVMPPDKFRPAHNADYTDSFVSQLQDRLRQVGAASFRKVPLWVTCLDMPTRQRIVFRDEFIRRRNTVQIGFEGNRRTLQIHRVGLAQREPCDDCKRGMGPFRRCVVDGDGDALRGACANCAFREKGHNCRYHRDNRNPSGEKADGKGTVKKSLKAKASQPQPGEGSNKRRHSIIDENRPTLCRLDSTTGQASSKSPSSRKKTKRQKLAHPTPETTVLIRSDVVFQDTAFSPGQASIEQVRYILNRCEADKKAFFNGAWLSWCSERTAVGRPQPFESMEAFLSEGWHEELNEMVKKVCPIDTG